ncbi:MAG: hypothetical protein ABEJ28_09525 [Salinigranum sp.]
MSFGGGTDSASGEDAVSFAHALDTLKHHGSALLVVGSVPDEAYARASRQMLGDTTGDSPRRRLLVVPEFERARAASRIRSGDRLTREWARIVVHAAAARSAAAGSVTPSGGPGTQSPAAPTMGEASSPPAEVVDGGIANLGITVSTVINEFDRAAGGLGPAELRVAFDCLPALLTEYDTETVFRFLHALTHHVKRVRGMGHFWLPREHDCDIVRTFGPLFDATIELRIDGGVVTQRWHFRDMDLVSDWLALPE